MKRQVFEAQIRGDTAAVEDRHLMFQGYDVAAGNRIFLFIGPCVLSEPGPACASATRILADKRPIAVRVEC